MEKATQEAEDQGIFVLIRHGSNFSYPLEGVLVLLWAPSHIVHRRHFVKGKHVVRGVRGVCVCYLVQQHFELLHGFIELICQAPSSTPPGKLASTAPNLELASLSCKRLLRHEESALLKLEF